jgi:hypothetical protein
MLLDPKIKHLGKILDREGKFPSFVHKILAYDQSYILPTHEPIAAYMGGIFELSKVLELTCGLYCGPKQCFYKVECKLFSISSSISSCASSFNVARRPVFGRFFTTSYSRNLFSILLCNC